MNACNALVRKETPAMKVRFMSTNETDCAALKKKKKKNYCIIYGSFTFEIWFGKMVHSQ